MFCSANGTCQAGSFCQQTNDTCQTGADCCSNICNPVAGASYGTCGPPPTAASNCSMVDGTVCGGVVGPDAGQASCGGSCCSRLCAPFGPTGVLICQPASGCHVVGDVCAADADCCGSAEQPGPGSGNVTCDFSAGGPLGVCRNPEGCKPNGDVCKLSYLSCNSSCDCCSGNCETEDTCRPDDIGIPRCTNVACLAAGQACATSADCCNNVPCVPNPNPGDGGSPLYCYPGGGGCVPACGACTVNADCCAGESCIIAQGAIAGICGPCNPGSDGGPGGSSSGGPSGGSSSGAGSSSGGSSGSSSGGTCALYGQLCTTSADCCNAVPCTAGRCESF